MLEACRNCEFPLTSEDRTKYGDRCRWCGAPEWRLESERSALVALGRHEAAQPAGLHA